MVVKCAGKRILLQHTAATLCPVSSSILTNTLDMTVWAPQGKTEGEIAGQDGDGSGQAPGSAPTPLPCSDPVTVDCSVVVLSTVRSISFFVYVSFSKPSIYAGCVARGGQGRLWAA